MKPILVCAALFVLATSTQIVGQLVDKNRAPNTANEGFRPLIGVPYPSQIGDGRTGSDPNASQSVIGQDPSVRFVAGVSSSSASSRASRGRARRSMGSAISTSISPSARVSPIVARVATAARRGSAGFRRATSSRVRQPRCAPTSSASASREMLADEITTRLRSIREHGDRAGVTEEIGGHPAPDQQGHQLRHDSRPAGWHCRHIGREGVDADLRVRPFFYHGGMFSIREFIVGALKNELGLAMAHDPDLATAHAGGTAKTATGMILNGLTDRFEPLPADEGDTAQSNSARRSSIFSSSTCSATQGRDRRADARREARPHSVRGHGLRHGHIPTLRIQRDGRVADVETVFDPPTATSIACLLPRSYNSRTRHPLDRRA